MCELELELAKERENLLWILQTAYKLFAQYIGEIKEVDGIHIPVIYHRLIFPKGLSISFFYIQINLSVKHKVFMDKFTHCFNIKRYKTPI